MQTDDAIVRVQALNGAWETIGADTARGVQPENIRLSSNEWGSDRASFDLRRDSGAVWPDLFAWSPVEVEVAGEVVWSGRILDTPGRDAEAFIINVQAEGWQYHLDDDQYQRSYIHTNLGDWKDIRAMTAADLTRVGTSAGQVTVGDGSITIGWPKGAQLNGSAPYVGVILDLGPLTNQVKRIKLNYEKESATASAGVFSLVVRNNSSPDIAASGAAYEDGSSTGITSLSAAGSIDNTFTTPRRYVGIMLFYLGAGVTLLEDNTIKITSIQVFTEAAYGDAAGLVASTVWTDALNKATLKLSTDRSLIQATLFKIEDFSMPRSELRTPREVGAAVNAFHNHIQKIDVERRPVFAARPTVPLLEIGDWSGAEIEDASLNSGAEIYNAVNVAGQDAAGDPIIVRRSSSQQPGSITEPIATPAAGNPSFATDTATWSVVGANGTLVRTTTAGEYDSSPGGGKFTVGPSGYGTQIVETFTGTFLAGVAYTLKVRAKGSVDALSASIALGVTAVDTGGGSISPLTTSFATYSLTWTPTADRTSGVTFNFINLTSGGPYDFFIDSISLERAIPTLVDRWGFRRSKTLPISIPLSSTMATQIGDVWLSSHLKSPFKGDVRIVGAQAVRRVLNGTAVHPSTLLRETGQLMRLSHRVDPNDGSQGRDGMIAKVDYVHDERAATVSLDNDRKNIEAYIARLAVVVGARLGGG